MLSYNKEIQPTLNSAADFYRQAYINLNIQPEGESQPTLCECCGNETKTVWGYINDGDKTVSAYFVQWTYNKKEHSPNFDF